MSPTALHLLLGLCLLILTLVASFASVKVVNILGARGGRSQLYLSLLNCFAGGVFLGVCFLDMIPDVNEKYEDFIVDRGKGFSFAWPQFLTCLGFFLVYVVEELCYFFMSRVETHTRSPSHSHAPPGGPSDTTSIHSDDKLFVELGAGGHGHSHDALPSGSLLRAMTFATAISFHSLLEGFALGIQDTTKGTVTLFLSLLLHKAVEAFSVGLQVSKGNKHRMKTVVATVIIYSLMSPLGCVVGTLVETSKNIKETVKDGVILLLESLAAGSFVYVTFLEVLAEEKANRTKHMWKLLAVFAGFLVISILMYIFGDEDDGVETPLCPVAEILNSTLSVEL